MDGGGAPADPEQLFEQLAEQLCAKPEIVLRLDGRFKAKCVFIHARKRYKQLDSTHTTRRAAADAVLLYLRKGATSKVVQEENNKVQRACGKSTAPASAAASSPTPAPVVPPVPRPVSRDAGGDDTAMPMACNLPALSGAQKRSRKSSWRLAGNCWTPAGNYAASDGVKATRLCGAPRTLWCRQSSAATCMASRSTTAGCPLSAGMRRLPPMGDGCGCGGSGRTGPAALPTWPPMVAEWSGVAGVHVAAPARLLERPRVEI